MAKTLADYKISFPYGATLPPYSPTRPHRGSDRACPIGTPIVIAGQTIALTGNTGLSSGPHCHTQAGTDQACQNTFEPTPLEFKPGIVVAIRKTDEKQWGKFVTLKVGNRYITYAHLSEVKVNIGQVIGESQMSTVGEVELDMLSRAFFGYPANAEFIKAWKGTETNTMIRWCDANPAHENWLKQIEAWKSDEGSFVRVSDLYIKKD